MLTTIIQPFLLDYSITNFAEVQTCLLLLRTCAELGLDELLDPLNDFIS